MKRLVVVFVCLFCVAGAYSEATSFSPQSSSDSDIARSENDQSVYRHLTLPNTLQVLLRSRCGQGGGGTGCLRGQFA